MRSRLLIATLAAVALGSALAPRPASAASAGGTAAGEPPAGSSTPGPVPASVRPGTANRKTGGSTARAAPIRISSASCVPAEQCTNDPRRVPLGGTLLLRGSGLRPGMVVVFPRAFNARVSRNSPGSRLRRSAFGLVVTVPGAAHSGRIMVLISRTRHTGSFGPISVFHRRVRPVPTKVPIPVGPAGGSPSGTAFDGQGMWIWYVSRSDAGNLAAIVARAHAAGVTTLFIKSSDGSQNYWSQFSPQLVQQLHANGIRACGWQYVYGSSPAGEAEMGARAVAAGADCLVIDAEAEYEGRYSAAQTYINILRAKIGPTFPLGLASFPYVSYHPAEPYSVFLGPGAAQFNAPQMYWKAIGVSVDTVYANTYIGNRPYGRPIYPLGQTYENVSSSELVRFRQEAVTYGATGVSFWDWQETSAGGWSALATPLSPLLGVTPDTTYPRLSTGSKGDQVLWMQEHLASAIPTQPTTGNFAAQTTANLKAFQSAHGIEASGVTDTATWAALLALPPVAVNWTGGGPHG
jgi:peptidoglycan hydrolase-like protein with peptidoglycan-binding domain